MSHLEKSQNFPTEKIVYYNENTTNKNENSEISDSLFFKAVKRITYLSLVLLSLALRKAVESITGIKFKKIQIDSRMVEQSKTDGATQQKVVRTEYHLRWRPWLEKARPLPASAPSISRWEDREEYDSLAPLPVIPRVKNCRSVQHRTTTRSGAVRSLSFPQDGGKQEQARLRQRAQQLTRQVAEWRRNNRAVVEPHPSLSADRLTQELALLQMQGAHKDSSETHEEVEEWRLDQESSGSTSEDEGLGNSPPLSPGKPVTPPTLLHLKHEKYPTGALSPPRTFGSRKPFNSPQFSPTGNLSPTGSRSPPHYSSLSAENISRIFNSNKNTLGSLSPNGSPPGTLRRVLKLRRVEGLSLGSVRR